MPATEINLQCSNCDRTFKSAFALRVHSRAHFKTKDHTYACKDCSLTFILKRELNFHTEHECDAAKKSWSCNLCKDRFENSDSLRQHFKEKHCEIKTSELLDLNESFANFSVTPLNGDFLSSTLVTMDVLNNSDRKKTFNCHLCEKYFNNRFNLSVHIKVHYSKKSEVFSCEICDLKFKQYIALRKHRRSLDHERRKLSELGKVLPIAAMNAYECLICEKTFDSKEALAKHSNSHSTTDPELNCETCGKHYKHKTSLKAHLNSKSHLITQKNAKMGLNDSANYPCLICHKNFNFKSTLSAHLKHHSLSDK